MPIVNTLSVIDSDHPQNLETPEERRDQRPYVFRQPSLSLKPKFTLGWELEANRRAVRVPAGIRVHSDGSVNGEAMEYVVMPAITKSPTYVLGLLKDLVHTPQLNTDSSCGFHVHVSASNLKLSQMREWAIATEYLAKRIEERAFKAVPDSRSGNQYCRPINLTRHGMEFKYNKYDNSRRYHWLNIVEIFRPGGIRTMEIRLLGHTHRWKYLLAWSLFCLELARNGWELSCFPFSIETRVSYLLNLLTMIEGEIKPLSKRNEPIPTTIYQDLQLFGISSESWDRPLAALRREEARVNCIYVDPYSDNQPIVRVEEDEENGDVCPCGCGEEGRCNAQVHIEDDCESDHCAYCHDNGDCSGAPTCRSCVEARHGRREHCGRVRCLACAPLLAYNTVNNTVIASTTSGHISPSQFVAGEIFRVTLLMDAHEEALSLDREHFTQTARAAQPASSRDAYCRPDCREDHNQDEMCGVCWQSWGYHYGHNCPNGERGSFPTGGI